MYWILRTLGDIESGWVLDVATGTGRFVEDLRFAFSFGSQPRAGNVKIIGVDRLRGAVAHASNDGEDVHYLAMDAARLGFPDNSFDVVCLVRALHHMTDATQVQALAEMYRVLKPDGRFFVAEMYRDGQTEPQMTDVLIHHWIAAVETAAAGPAARWVHRETFHAPRSSASWRALGCVSCAFVTWLFPARKKQR